MIEGELLQNSPSAWHIWLVAAGRGATELRLYSTVWISDVVDTSAAAAVSALAEGQAPAQACVALSLGHAPEQVLASLQQVLASLQQAAVVEQHAADSVDRLAQQDDSLAASAMPAEQEDLFGATKSAPTLMTPTATMTPTISFAAPIILSSFKSLLRFQLEKQSSRSQSSVWTRRWTLGFYAQA
jgi:hypothetical protein